MLVVVSAALFVALSTYFNLATDAFLEADGVTHYLYARFSFQTPAYFVDVWARPFRMVLHALPATYFGVHGVRATSMLLALATAALAWRAAWSLKLPRPELAFVFTLAQPATFFHSFQELTELPFAFLVAVAFVGLVEKRWVVFAVACALMPTARPEGFAVLALAAIACVCYRRWLEILILPLGLIFWSILGSTLHPGSPWYRWLPDHFPYSAKSTYAAGSILKFGALLPAVVGPLILPFALVGAWKLATATRSIAEGAVARYVAVGLPLCVLIGHSVLHALGLMSSSGDIRYLVSFAPLWALWPVLGWPVITQKQFRGIALASVCILPLLANIWWRVLPTKIQPDAIAAKELFVWTNTLQESERPMNILTTHPAVLYYFDRPIGDVRLETLDSAPAGTWMVWDPLMSSANASPERVIRVEAMKDWRELDVPIDSVRGAFRVFIK